MKILYFASLRERLNRSEDDVSPPAQVETVADLIQWLRTRDEALDLALQNLAAFKVSVDARMRPLTWPLGSAQTIAILPPMTGG